MSEKISLQQTVQLVQNYVTKKQPLLTKYIQQSNSNQVESTLGKITLNELKDYITTIEILSIQANIDIATVGLDIYFGSYPADPQGENSDQLTMAFVPNLQEPNTNFIFTNDEGEIKAQMLSDLVNTKVINEEFSILNRLGMTPPPETKTDLEKLFNK